MGELISSPTSDVRAATKPVIIEQDKAPNGTKIARRVAAAVIGIASITGNQSSASGTSVEHSLVSLHPRQVEEKLPHNSDDKEKNDYSYSALSSPDFLNFDVGDVRKLPTWRPGDPNSYDAILDDSLQTILGTFQNEDVRDVLVAGDLVQGHWGMDTAHTGLFGPTSTTKHRRKAVGRAATFYFNEWQDRFDDLGLTTFAAIGDHDVGDDPWNGNEHNRFKQRNLHVFKMSFSQGILRNPDGSRRFDRHPDGPAANTAYAVRLNPEVELITLDVFKKTSHDVAITVDDRQLEWAKRQMAKAREQGVDWLVVQYHTPVIGGIRKSNSSGLMYQGGTQSELWQALKKYHVNLVLNGEVHAITARQLKPGEPVQISHGGAIQHGLTNYLRLDFNPDSVEIEAIGFDVKMRTAKNGKVWQTDTHKSVKRLPVYSNPHEVGSMTLSRGGKILERSGLLKPYDD